MSGNVLETVAFTTLPKAMVGCAKLYVWIRSRSTAKQNTVKMPTESENRLLESTANGTDLGLEKAKYV